MQREKKDKHFIKKPYYEGGLNAMRQFITSKLSYPEEALEKKIEGTVHVRYTIDRAGQVIAAKVIAGIGYGCDEEAIRVVRLLQFVAPRNLVQNIKFHKTIQIHFRLPSNHRHQEQELPQEGGIQYTYSIVPSSERQVVSQGKSEEAVSRNYLYSIPTNSSKDH